TFTPTVAPTLDPRPMILMGGYNATALRANTFGQFNAMLLCQAPADLTWQVDLYYLQQPTGFTGEQGIQDPAKIVSWSVFSPPLPAQSYVFEFMPQSPSVQGDLWPYLTIR